jgi:hypothetical protein
VRNVQYLPNFAWLVSGMFEILKSLATDRTVICA